MTMINKISKDSNLIFMTEYIKNILYFAVVKHGKVIKSSLDIHFFTIDDELVYENFYNDFGPLNLGCVYKYCNILNEKLNEYLNKQVIVHYTSADPKKKANAAFLLGCYGVLYLKLAPKDALKPFYSYEQNYRCFQDAVPGDSCHTITLMDCLNAIKRANNLSFFKFNDFSYEEYDKWSRYNGGDLTWIVPGKFVAFIGPIESRFSLHSPEKYIRYFKENEVNVVIRLNERHYDANIFHKAGIKHYDLLFPDGSCPPRYILLKFLQISEESDGAIAVHCKAGLGRTGSLIGCYLIKHYRMSAREAIGWMRICRPGSVIGHQQDFLEKWETWLLKQGNIYRKMMYEDVNKIFKHEFGIYSIEEKFYKSHSLANEQFLRPTLQTRTCGTEKRKAVKQFNCGASKIASKDQNQGSLSLTKSIHVDKSPFKKDFGLNRIKNDDANKKYCYLNRKDTNNTYEDYNSVNRTLYCRGVSHSKLPPLSTPKCNLSNRSISNKNNSKKNTKFDVCNRNDDSKILRSTLTMTPKFSYSLSSKPIPQTLSYFNSESRTKISNGRRRLGRSPSPSPSRIPTEHRATNTPVVKRKLLRKESSLIALKEALSKLKVSKPRDNSVGLASLGARSGLQTGAPRRCTSARSYEQPLATQGDLLNSIKNITEESEVPEICVMYVDKARDLYRDGTKWQWSLALPTTNDMVFQRRFRQTVKDDQKKKAVSGWLYSR